MIGNKSLLLEGLPDDCHFACVCAMSNFETICQRLERGEITLVELKKMNKQKNQVKRLCEAITSSKKSHLFGSVVLTSLSQRLIEFERFSSRCQAYKDICKWLTDPGLPRNSIQGMLYVMWYTYLCVIPNCSFYRDCRVEP